MNKVLLVGRLTDEPKVSYGNNGTTITRISVAVDRRFKQDGQPSADFPNCVAFGKTAEFIEKYFHKGYKIGLAGRIQTGSYEKDGKKVYTTDVVIEEVEFVESANKSKSAKPTSNPADGFMNIPDNAEDCPFK